MFQLKAKHESALISNNFKQLMVSMRWTTPVDFDIFAVYQTQTGRLGIIYYADMGDLNKFPYIQLSGDEGVNDTGGDNEETLVISNLTEMKYVWICCWDYQQVIKQTQGRFDNCDLSITVIDDGENSGGIQIPLVDHSRGNTALVLTIDRSNPITSNLVNTSQVTTLNGLDTQSLIKFLQASVSSNIS